MKVKDEGNNPIKILAVKMVHPYLMAQTERPGRKSTFKMCTAL